MGWRAILGIVGGVVAGLALVLVFQVIGGWLFPAPPEVTTVEDVSTAAKIEFLLGFAIASAAGGAVGAWLGRTQVAAFAVGGILMGTGLTKMFSAPHPTWIIIVGALFLLTPAIASGWYISRNYLPPPAKSPYQH